MHYRCVFTMLKSCMLVGLDWVEPMISLLLHVTCSCIFHAYVPFFFFLLILCLVIFCLSLSLSLSVICSWHQRRTSLLHPGTLFNLGHLLLLPLLILHPLTFDFVMRRPVRTSQRTFHDAAFIWNAKSSYQTFSILTFPLSSTVRVGSHCVASRSPVPP